MHYVTAKGILLDGNFGIQKEGGYHMNLYRGCVHGCIYCDSRSRCYHIDHKFEDIEVKENALELLENELRKKRKRCMIGTGSMTDPYIPLEKELCHVRKSMELVERYGFGFTLITKSNLVLRDIDLLQKINNKTKAVVQMTLTTADEDLCRKLEPNVSTTKERFDALCKLRDAGIPTVVWICPILPYINDTKENISAILDMCIEAKVKGILWFGPQMTLREGDREYYYQNLDRMFPGLKEKYISEYGNSYEVKSPRFQELNSYVHEVCEQNGIMHRAGEVFHYLAAFEEKNAPKQMTLWDL